MDSTGKKIKELRLAKKITQKKLGEIIGRSAESVKKYESGEVIPPHNVLRDIARALDVPVFALQTISPEDMAAIKNSISSLNSTFVEAMQELVKSVQTSLEPLQSEEMQERIKATQEMLNHDIAYLLLYKEKAFYNLHQLTQEERQRVLDMLKILFPEYSEGMEDNNESEKEGE